LIILEEFYNVTPAGGAVEMSARAHGGHRQSLEILSELRGHRRHNVNGRVIRWCSGTPLLADDGQDIIADARRRSPARRPAPRRSGFCGRAGKALD
jgi:hypothetical protein